ncbi:ribosome maturation factor RimM [Tessaracoccus sp. MC1865]|uniref:ribosome maturation factor RimM n=1 Tax=Tessaracoccus sp. MC1865 TaxID=2760310 RepID=UPI0015FEF102|nr:ribosome maturation factor RimM [Tessaracoccus sp. MC1865]MBB1484334.1 ribosome maturation factor RimM [Tessaracoccus sp. MC1865]QTO38552.1 ribosome maturation factor RimM [Tessaracoccus sp. MC1865]
MSEIEVIVGRIGRAHGLRGEVFIDVRTDEPARRFIAGGTLQMGDKRRPVKLASVRWNRGRLLVGFADTPDRTAVEKLTGELLYDRVAESELPSEPEEFFDRHLVGLVVRDHTGAERGTVTEVLHLPAQDVLQLDVDGEERLVPFVEALVPTVEVEAGYIQLADVPGLLEDIE